MPGFTVKVYRTYFLEDEVYEGDYMNAPNTYTQEDEYPNSHAVDVVRLCTEYGLTFGDSWAYQMDGSQIVNYATGERVEISLHLPDDLNARIANAIRAAVR